jgi:hypothetical protein
MIGSIVGSNPQGGNMIDASEFSNVRREVEVFLETIKKDEKYEDSDYESDEKTIILKE